MTNLTTYPLQDNFKTTLSQEWTGGTGTVYVANTPSFTFPSGVTTYIVASPGKTTMQIAKISAYDATAKTLTVSSITLKKGASINSTAQTHSVGSEIIISDNYQFWEDIYTAVNSKIDGRIQGVYFFADATARDSELGASPATNGLIAGLTSEGKITYSLGGSWLEWSTTSSTFNNASTTVAGKVEIATTAQSIAGTDTGETGAKLVAIPSDIAKNIQSSTFVYGADAGGDDTYVVTLNPVLSAYTTGQRLRFKVTTANTGACSVDFGPGVLNIKNRDGADPVTGQVYGIVEGIYDGTNFVLETAPTLATDAEATTGTVINKSITPKQGKDNYLGVTDVITFTRDIAGASGDVTYNHSLGKAPKRIDFYSVKQDGAILSIGSYATTTNTNKGAFIPADGQGNTGSYSVDYASNSAHAAAQRGVVSAVSTTNFTITWEKVGSPTGLIMTVATLIA